MGKECWDQLGASGHQNDMKRSQKTATIFISQSLSCSFGGKGVNELLNRKLVFLRNFEHMKIGVDCLLNNKSEKRIMYSLMTLREERAMTSGGGTKEGL